MNRKLKISANWGIRIKKYKEVKDQCNLVDKKEYAGYKSLTTGG